MARTVRDTNLETRTARSRLSARSKPYWRSIDQGNHLGYYKGKRGGSWVGRYNVGERRYKETTFGTADDIQDADGLAVLSFAQAQEQARAWFAEQARQKAGIAHSGPYTVKDAMVDYLAWYEVERKDLSNARYRNEALILPSLGNKEVSKLTLPMLRTWHQKVATTAPRIRTKRGKSQQYLALSDDPEQRRQRRATANRVLTLLKAALNHAWRDGKIASDDAWRRLKPFRSVEAPRVRYLKDVEITRLVNACDPDFRQLVRGALLTGCRYGELAAMRCGDFNPDTGSVFVQAGKSGKGRYVTLSDEGRNLFAEITAGKPSDALIFARADGGTWGKSHQTRPLAEACKRAKISPAISFHILRHTHASHLAMQGVPLMVIAKQLGHSDTRMAERHYAHLAQSYVADTIRAAMPDFGIFKPGNVKPFAPHSAQIGQ
jgi:integrase